MPASQDVLPAPIGPVCEGGRGNRVGLESLPDEILLSVVKNFECTRDISALARTSKRLQRCVDTSTAWRDFVRFRFPHTDIPGETGEHNYKALAESMTYQSRCWDRKSIRFTLMYPAQQPQRRLRGQDFRTVVDVDYDMNAGRETLVWGAGENIVARFRHRVKGQTQQPWVEWRQHTGSQHGLLAGRDDVSTMNIVNLPHLTGPAMLVGRENGDLSLLSANPNDNFGRQLANFDPRHPGGIVVAEGDEQPRQQQIMSVDILSDTTTQNLVAACSNLGVGLYQLPQDINTTTIAPIEVYDVAAMTGQQVWNAKWMGSRNLLALASRGTPDPLRYLSVTPSGFLVEAAAKNAQLESQLQLRNTSLHSNSLQPVHRYPGMTDPTPLLLSSWQDGTVRLQDIRTPSAFDTAYQNNVSPFSQYGSLLTYGADRFVAGDHSSSMIKIFDFRWPKPYFHTTGLPCGPHYPFRFVEQRFTLPPADPTGGRPRCDRLLGLRCRWHELSRDVYYRPNVLFMLSQSLPAAQRGARVSNLAKASDVAPVFYAGITGAVVECNLGAIDSSETDPHLGFPDYQAPPPPPPPSGGGGYASRPMSATMMELGDGLRSVGNDANIVMPMVHSRTRDRDVDWRDRRALADIPPALRRKHRLDESFQRVSDFSQDVDVDELVRRTQGLGLG